MALGARTTFEIRPGGSSLAGGGFNPANATPGTDQTQQVTSTLRTDLVIGAANSLTSAGTPFQASELGNLIHITAGVNFTPGFYELVSIVGAVVTLDRSPGTLAASGGTGRVGGALSAVPDLPTIPDGNIVWAQGSFTTAVQWAPNGSGTDGRFITLRGYTTTRGDNGLATLTASANLAPVLLLGAQTILQNFKVDGANLSDRGVDFGIDCYFENIWVTRCNLSGVRAQNEGTRGRRSLFTFNGAGAAAGTGLDAGTGVVVTACEAHDNKQGFSSSNGSGEFEWCVSHNNTASGFYQGGDDGMRLKNCILDGNAVDGLQINDTGGATTMEVVNCFFTNNGGKGQRSVATDYGAAVSAPMARFFQNNAFFNNTGGNYGQVPQGASDVILTQDPYTNRAGGDYTLNGAAGGGALVLGQGIPGGVGLLGSGAMVSVGHLDIGAFQSLGSGATPSATATMRSLWREATNERFTPSDVNSAVPDATVDIYLDYGLQEMNRQVHYHISDASIPLLAGQQEYPLPEDFVLAEWLQYGSFRKLERSDVERWMSRGEDWRNEPVAEPKEWALYANKLVLRPAPSAEAVAAAPNLTLRYCSTPPSITTNGPEQLGSEEYRLVVLYGALLWSILYPESLVAQQRIVELDKLWDKSLPAVIQQYASRSISS